MNYKKQAYRTSAIAMLANFSIAVLKLLAGALGGSTALISDGVDSMADVFSSLIVIIGVKFASKSPDEDHPYGHERFECISSIVLGLIIAASGLAIGFAAVQKLLSPQTMLVPSAIALAAALVSIVVKLWLCIFTKNVGTRIGSDSLLANAANFRSDMFSSLGVLVSIIGARLGLSILDPLASLVICVLILRSAVQILLDALSKMMDSSVDRETLDEMRQIILACDGVLRLDDIKTRTFGSRYFVEVEIACDGNMTLHDSHEIASTVHDEIEQLFPATKHCLVHVNPMED